MLSKIKLIDYCVFMSTIITYAVIGIYFGCFGSKQKSAKEYIYGRRSLKAIPIGLSIFSSSVSTVAMLGIPQEIYIFGIQYFLNSIGVCLSLIITWKFVIPVFKGGNRKFRAPYEYFEYRFSNKVRIFASVIYIINSLSAVPIVLYTCCLPVSEATGINVFICAIVLGGICVMYTMLGGFTTVIWTDVVQAILMLFTLIFLTTSCVIRAGGFKTIWVNAEKTGRTELFDFDLNPFKRLSFWSAIIGMMFNFASYQGCAASTLQRYLSVETEKDAKISVFIGMCGFIFNSLSGTIIGLCMITIYYGCDPVANKELDNYNQLTPNLALETLSIIPGLSGMFIAGLLSAGMSSISAELNTVSGMIYYDFIQKSYKTYSSDKKGALLMKILVFLFGVYFIGMVFIVQKIKYIIQMVITLAGTSHGLKLGVLILGVAFPKSNTKGALTGMTIAGIFMVWLTINSAIYNVGSLDALPVSTENCTHTNNTFSNDDVNFNYTTVLPLIDEILNPEKPEPFFLYKLSFLYYTLFGTIITVCISLLVSYATGGNDIKNMDPTLFIPWVRPKNVRQQEHLEELQDILKKESNN